MHKGHETKLKMDLENKSRTPAEPLWKLIDDNFFSADDGEMICVTQEMRAIKDQPLAFFKLLFLLLFFIPARVGRGGSVVLHFPGDMIHLTRDVIDQGVGLSLFCGHLPFLLPCVRRDPLFFLVMTFYLSFSVPYLRRLQC